MTALVVHSCRSADETFQRHMPFYTKTGFDVYGVGRVDNPSSFPLGVKNFNIGLDQRIHKDNLVRRFVDTFKFCLESRMFALYSDFCVVEYDCLFFKPLPKHPGGLVATLAGYAVPGALATKFYHCPWWADRAMAEIIVDEGQKLLDQKIYELGSPDFFLGLICDRRAISPITIPFYSRNTIEPGWQMAEARQAYLDGVYGMHGVKTKATLDSIVF